MSGYLEVKYSFKSNLGLNPFKTWKRQWCILRPSPTWSGGSLAVYCSEAGAAAGAVELPAGGAVRRTKSRSRAHAFAVFSPVEPHKPRILLAAPTSQDAQLWMDKIRSLLDGKQILGAELLKDSYSVSVAPSQLSRRLGLSGDAVVTVSADGVRVSRSHKLETFIEWRHVKDTAQITDPDKNRICVLNVTSEFHGGGRLALASPAGAALAAALARRARRSEGDLRAAGDDGAGESRRSSWSSDAPGVTVDETDLVVLKESSSTSSCGGEGSPAPDSRDEPDSAADLDRAELVTPAELDARAVSARARLLVSATIDDCMSDRRSLLSISSGVYEEIGEATRGAGAEAGAGAGAGAQWAARWEEPAYESVAECVYGTARRARPPPLPPRLPFGTSKPGESWNSRANAPPEVSRHGSLGSLPRCSSLGARTLPKSTRQAFSVFRKRLKSDSRLVSPKSDVAKENKDVETKKKKFDFAPTRDLFRNFRVGRKTRDPKIAAGGLGKGEAKSCECLEGPQRAVAARGARSAECLDAAELSDEADAELAAVVQLVARARRHAPLGEGDYTPMSPIAPPAPAAPAAPPAPAAVELYMVMSPRTNLA